MEYIYLGLGVLGYIVLGPLIAFCLFLVIGLVLVVIPLVIVTFLESLLANAKRTITRLFK